MTIVYNGERTIGQCIRNLLSVMDRVIVVEGAVKGMSWSGTTGSSTDRTNDIVDMLKYDNPDKLVVVRGRGLWRDKIDMCNAAAKQTEPGVLWEVDADEFWLRDSIEQASAFIEENDDYGTIEFWGRHFFGGFMRHVEMKPIWGNRPAWRRCFRNECLGWAGHRPPDMNHSKKLKVMDRDASLKAFNATLFHYGYCWRSQAVEKYIYHAFPHQTQILKAFDSEVAGSPQDYVPLVNYNGPHPVDVASFL